MIPIEWFLQARERIAPHILTTPVLLDPDSGNIFKLENRQTTGSFKLRGALNKVLSLNDWEYKHGLVAASAGNHGQGVAMAARLVGAHATVFVPQDVSSIKLDAMRQLGAEVILVEGGYELAEVTAQKFASEQSAAWISPYNDGQVIAGQGTIALELADQVPLEKINATVIPVSGGGLIAGMGLVLKHFHPNMRIIGVQAAGSPFMHGLFYHNSQDGIKEIIGLADGLEGMVEEHSITIPIVRSVVDEIILVTETEIEKAIAYAWRKWQERIEGSAAVTLAGLLSGKIETAPSVFVFSGGNIQSFLHEQVILKYHEDNSDGK
jgi:threonine dehydratase